MLITLYVAPALMSTSPHFDEALAKANSIYPKAPISAELIAALNSINCASVSRVNLGTVTATSGKSTVSAPAGTMTFVKCANGDRFALQLPGATQMEKSGGRMRATGEMKLTKATVAGRPSAFDVRSRPDKSKIYTLAWQATGGYQVITVLYDAQSDGAGKSALNRIVSNLAPVLR